MFWLTRNRLFGSYLSLSSTSRAYFSGLIGPMRGDDRKVAKTLAFADDTPSWANADQLSCASEHLVRTQGVSVLSVAGVLAGTSGHYTYTGRWPSADLIVMPNKRWASEKSPSSTEGNAK